MKIVILSGAGISAESGLSTFSGPSGLWNECCLEEVCTPHAFRRDPNAVCAFYDERRKEAMRADPNAAHLALARLERCWRENVKGEFLLVTQNIDDLHERAGTKRVIHMHGQLNSAFCIECGWQGPRHGRLEGNRECPICEREALRPDIVLFGEAPRQLFEIEEALKSCDLFVAIGTSGTVFPAAGFVEIAKSHGAETHRFDVEQEGSQNHFDIHHIGPATRTVQLWAAAMIEDQV